MILILCLLRSSIAFEVLVDIDSETVTLFVMLVVGLTAEGESLIVKEMTCG